jgi:hypothetical protein
MSGRHQPDMVAHVRCAMHDTVDCTRLAYLAHIDMINIFEVFLPQLLRYPNPNDPLNGEAAALMMRHPKEYEAKVKGKPFITRAGYGGSDRRAAQSTCSATLPRRLRTRLPVGKKRKRTRR